MRRIEAITGRAAIQDANHQTQILNSVSSLLKVRADDVPAQVEKILAEDKILKKELDEVHAIEERAEAQKLLMGIEEIGAIKFLSGVAQARDMDELRSGADYLLNQLENGVVVLAAVEVVQIWLKLAVKILTVLRKCLTRLEI